MPFVAAANGVPLMPAVPIRSTPSLAVPALPRHTAHGPSTPRLAIPRLPRL